VPDVPQLTFHLVDVGAGPGLPVEQNEAYQMLLDNAVAGGSGTATYLGHMFRFSGLTDHLAQAGPAAFVESDGPDPLTRQATATAPDGTSTMTVGLRLNEGLQAQPVTPGGTPVVGIATVRMALPAPYEIVKFVELGIGIGEIPAGIVVTQALWDALFSPLLQQVTGWVQTTVSDWLRLDVGEDVDIDALGESIESTADDAAEAAAEEAAEVIVEEEVVAEVAIDLAAAVPALGALGLILAVPLLIEALAKNFQLHIEVDNLTDHDFAWDLAYQYGATTVKPAAAVLPRMGRATDAWGDETDIPVVYQANFACMNTSGFAGTGLVLHLSSPDLPGEDVAAVVSVPWLEDNAVWVGDGDGISDWKSLFDDHSSSDGQERAGYGNRRLAVSLAIDALSGHGDAYHAVLRIESL
jgi:hypothetical protein